jgi:hypothetical protein
MALLAYRAVTLAEARGLGYAFEKRADGWYWTRDGDESFAFRTRQAALLAIGMGLVARDDAWAEKLRVPENDPVWPEGVDHG